MKRTPRKYERGFRPCGKCQSFRHYGCRPKIDGSLCTCTCPKACETREVKATLDAERLAAGLLPVTTAELNKAMHRRGPYSAF
jgi:hypothetical protein